MTPVDPEITFAWAQGPSVQLGQCGFIVHTLNQSQDFTGVNNLQFNEGRRAMGIHAVTLSSDDCTDEKPQFICEYNGELYFSNMRSNQLPSTK